MPDLDAYDYELPHELIAQQPLANRADSRLMIVDRQARSIEHLHFRDLPEFVRAQDSLVLNDTRVVPAKLVGYRDSTGGRWQGLYLEHDDRGLWKLLCKTRGKLVEGESIGLVDRQGRAAGKLHLLTQLDDGVWGAKLDSDEGTFAFLERVGRVPLPHYIRHGEGVTADIDAYQTVFATHQGSVAAPTAGLHFTTSLLDLLKERGTTVANVTLHVGVGTFRPIKADSLDAHQMHSEWCAISGETVDTLSQVKAGGGRVIAVGTTSVRTLETAAQGGPLQPFEGRTELFIRPPYEFQAVDALITNFHLPRSSLLVLVHAFGGRELMQQAYRQAVEEEYRFFSYGDAMLIL